MVVFSIVSIVELKIPRLSKNSLEFFKFPAIFINSPNYPLQLFFKIEHNLHLNILNKKLIVGFFLNTENFLNL